MKKSAFSLVLLSMLLACNNSSVTLRGQGSATKGNDAFKAMMAQGAGRVRPEAIKTGSALGLNSNAISSVKLDEASGAWAWVGFDTSLSDAVKADQDLVQAAQDFIGKYEAELGFSPGEILAEAGAVQSPYAGTKLVTLQRQYQGLPIKGAFINFFFVRKSDQSLRLSEIVNNSFGAVKIAGNIPPMPSDAEALEATGSDDFQVTARRPVIQPVLNKNGRYEFSYASEFKLKDKMTDEDITMTLDNATRDIREAFSNHVSETNQVNAETYDRSYVLKDLLSRPFQFAKVIDGSKTTATDEQGNVDSSNKQVSIVLNNVKNKSNVFDAKGKSFEAADVSNPVAFPLTLDASGKSVIKLGATDAEIAPINVFVAMQETVAFVSKYFSPQELKIINNGFDAVVNMAGACNAFYGNKLFLFGGNSQCANMGLISDVVKHEWGHGVDDFLGPNSKGTNGRSGITDAAYSEGIGDVLSSYMGRSPDLAPGFYLNDPAPLRVIQNDRTHPPLNAYEGEAHSAGQIVAGAFWDMHQKLSELYGADKGNEIASRLFLRHLMTSDRYLDAYQAVLRVDDDDNNPATKSPNYCNITRAFSRHNISGGETADADCLDTDTSVRVKIDFDQGNGLLSVFASAAGAAKIIACPGKVTSCKADTTGYVEFTGADGDDVLTVKGARKFYTATGTLDAKANGSYTFLSLDSKDQVLAKRVLDFKTESSEESSEPTPALTAPTTPE